MSKEIDQNLKNLHNLLTHYGWTRDRWLHYHFGEFRFKCGPMTLRFEHKSKGYGWVMRRSWYYSKIDWTALVACMEEAGNVIERPGQPSPTAKEGQP